MFANLRKRAEIGFLTLRGAYRRAGVARQMDVIDYLLSEATGTAGRDRALINAPW